MNEKPIGLITKKELLLVAAQILEEESEKRRGHGKSEIGPKSKRLASELRDYVAQVRLDDWQAQEEK